MKLNSRGVEGHGIWPAFWMYAGNPNNEIDFFELKGEREDQLHVDIHCPDGCSNFKDGMFGYRRGWGHWIKLDGKLKESFNVLAGEWTPEYIKWFLNGELIAYSDKTFDMPMGLTAGTGIAKNGEAFKPGPNSRTPFPNVFEVDYIRIYKSDTLPVKIKNALNSIEDSILYSTKNLTVGKKNTKLKNNKGPKSPDSQITVSLVPVSKNIICIRILGVDKKDKISISIVADGVRTEKKITQNSEVFLNVSSKFYFQANINDQSIKQDIQLD